MISWFYNSTSGPWALQLSHWSHILFFIQVLSMYPKLIITKITLESQPELLVRRLQHLKELCLGIGRRAVRRNKVAHHIAGAQPRPLQPRGGVARGSEGRGPQRIGYRGPGGVARGERGRGESGGGLARGGRGGPAGGVARGIALVIHSLSLEWAIKLKGSECWKWK